MNLNQSVFLDNLKNEIKAVAASNNVSYSTILNFYRRFSTFIQRWTKLENKDDIEIVAKCCLKFISFIQNYIDGQLSCDLRQHKIDKLRRCMAVLQEMSRLEGTRNDFFVCIVKQIFQMVSVPNIKVWFANELINCLSKAIVGTRMDLRHKIAEDNILYICKLTDIICTCGDYMYQLSLLEVIFSLCSADQINKYAAQMFPMRNFQKALCEMDRLHFYKSSRVLLNMLNKELKLVVSLKCVRVVLGSIEVDPPKHSNVRESELWADFNLGTKSITINCDKDSLRTLPPSQSLCADDTDCELITVYVENVVNLKIKVLSNIDTYIMLLFTMSQPCNVRYTTSFPVANQPQLKVIIKDSEVKESISQILTDWFGKTFSSLQETSSESIPSPPIAMSMKESTSPTSISAKSQMSSTSDAMSLKARMQTFQSEIESKEYCSVLKTPEIKSLKVLKKNAEDPEYIRLAKEQEAKKLGKNKLQQESEIHRSENKTEVLIKNIFENSEISNHNVSTVEGTCISPDSDIFDEKECVSLHFTKYAKSIGSNKTMESIDIETLIDIDQNISSTNHESLSPSSLNSREASEQDVCILGEPAHNSNSLSGLATNNTQSMSPGIAGDQLDKLMRRIQERGILGDTVFQSEKGFKTSTSESPGTNGNKYNSEQNVVESSQLDTTSPTELFSQTLEKLRKRENESLLKETLTLDIPEIKPLNISNLHYENKKLQKKDRRVAMYGAVQFRNYKTKNKNKSNLADNNEIQNMDPRRQKRGKKTKKAAKRRVVKKSKLTDYSSSEESDYDKLPVKNTLIMTEAIKQNKKVSEEIAEIECVNSSENNVLDDTKRKGRKLTKIDADGKVNSPCINKNADLHLQVSDDSKVNKNNNNEKTNEDKYVNSTENSDSVVIVKSTSSTVNANNEESKLTLQESLIECVDLTDSDFEDIILGKRKKDDNKVVMTESSHYLSENSSKNISSQSYANVINLDAESNAENVKNKKNKSDKEINSVCSEELNKNSNLNPETESNRLISNTKANKLILEEESVIYIDLTDDNELELTQKELMLSASFKDHSYSQDCNESEINQGIVKKNLENNKETFVDSHLKNDRPNKERDKSTHEKQPNQIATSLLNKDTNEICDEDTAKQTINNEKIITSTKENLQNKVAVDKPAEPTLSEGLIRNKQLSRESNLVSITESVTPMKINNLEENKYMSEEALKEYIIPNESNKRKIVKQVVKAGKLLKSKNLNKTNNNAEHISPQICGSNSENNNDKIENLIDKTDVVKSFIDIQPNADSTFSKGSILNEQSNKDSDSLCKFIGLNEIDNIGENKQMYKETLQTIESPNDAERNLKQTTKSMSNNELFSSQEEVKQSTRILRSNNQRSINFNDTRNLSKHESFLSEELMQKDQLNKFFMDKSSFSKISHDDKENRPVSEYVDIQCVDIIGKKDLQNKGKKSKKRNEKKTNCEVLPSMQLVDLPEVFNNDEIVKNQGYDTKENNRNTKNTNEYTIEKSIQLTLDKNHSDRIIDIEQKKQITEEEQLPSSEYSEVVCKKKAIKPLDTSEEYLNNESPAQLYDKNQFVCQDTKNQRGPRLTNSEKQFNDLIGKIGSGSVSKEHKNKDLNEQIIIHSCTVINPKQSFKNKKLNEHNDDIVDVDINEIDKSATNNSLLHFKDLPEVICHRETISSPPRETDNIFNTMNIVLENCNQSLNKIKILKAATEKEARKETSDIKNNIECPKAIDEDIIKNAQILTEEKLGSRKRMLRNRPLKVNLPATRESRKHKLSDSSDTSADAKKCKRSDTNKQAIDDIVNIESKKIQRNVLRRNRSTSQMRKLYNLDETSCYEFTEQNSASEELTITNVDDSRNNNGVDTETNTKSMKVAKHKASTKQHVVVELEKWNEFERSTSDQSTLTSKQNVVQANSQITQKEYDFKLLLDSMEQAMEVYSKKVDKFNNFSHKSAKGKQTKRIRNKNHYESLTSAGVIEEERLVNVQNQLDKLAEDFQNLKKQVGKLEKNVHKWIKQY